MKKETMELLARVMDNPVVIDMHNGQELKLQGVAISEGEDVCPIFLNTHFCLNPLFIGKDGRVKLSESSVGVTSLVSKY